MTYTIKVKTQAKKDLKKLKGSSLEANFLEIIQVLTQNLYAAGQSFEKLVPPIKGFYSRRINRQHRVVYRVDQSKKEVIIYSAYSHYE